MKITMLGCGTSVGVPSLGILGWGKCNPDNPKNRRQRSSVLIQENGFNILIDAGPDVRNQLLNTKERVSVSLVDFSTCEERLGQIFEMELLIQQHNSIYVSHVFIYSNFTFKKVTEP